MRRAAPLLALAALPACVTAVPYDYGPFLAHQPHSILVLPPLNQSPEVQASYSYLSTVTAPLAERGYYVFPVALVDELMRQNGCPTPVEMHQVPPGKLREVFGADAVLYLTVKQWGTSYVVLDSVTTVTVDARLVDLRSEEPFWSKTAVAARHSSEGGSDPFAMALAALINQIITSGGDPSHDLAPAVNASLVGDPRDGMLLGPRHSAFAADQAKRRATAGPQAAPPPQ
jgi:hypothetical protein